MNETEDLIRQADRAKTLIQNLLAEEALVTEKLEAVLGFKIIPYTGPVETGWKDGKPQPPRHAVDEPLIQHRNGKSRMASETEVMLWELLRRTEVR